MTRLLLQLLFLTIVASRTRAFSLAPAAVAVAASSFTTHHTTIPSSSSSLSSSSSSSSSTTALALSNNNNDNDGKLSSTVISPDDVDFEFDTGLGGVRLAQESAVKMSGTIQHNKGGAATLSFRDLVRYTGLVTVTENVVQEELQKVGGTILCTGQGQELYQDPGDALEKIVILGPMDAVQDACKGASPAVPADTEKVVINVLGGNDLQFLEVKDALESMVPNLAIVGKTKLSFHSLSHESIPDGQVTVTAVALPAEVSSNGLSGMEKAIVDGEVYFYNGQWWTVVEDDINTAVA